MLQEVETGLNDRVVPDSCLYAPHPASSESPGGATEFVLLPEISRQ
jgi:hypothetical protein